uniref:Transmembrane protein 60 n=1 Tax=Cacopsylla melanoneura TaxID=428564 RepID=A0A8D8W948_9HEMI
MTVLHRALFTWFLFLVFLILLVLRLDVRTQWNWFVVFAPLWAYLILLFFYLTIKLVQTCKYSSIAHNSPLVYNKILNLCCVFMLIVSLIVFCAKLENLIDISYVFVFLPLWLCLPPTIIYVFVGLLKGRNNRYLYS